MKSQKGIKVREEMKEFIISYIVENGYPPTTREIGKGVNLKSTSSVHSHLKRMEREGVIKCKLDTPRAIKVLGYEFVKK